MTREGIESANAKRLNWLREQYSKYVDVHTILDKGAQLDGAFMRWESELLLKQVEKRPRSFGRLQRVLDIIRTFPQSLLKHESLSDLISERELEGTTVLQWNEEEQEEVLYRFHTKGHAIPERAKEIWFVKCPFSPTLFCN